MKDILKFGMILGLVSIMAGLSLAWVNNLTSPKVNAQQKKELSIALNLVLPGADEGMIMIDDSIQTYTAYARKDTTKLIGQAFLIESQGYSSLIRTLAGIDSAGKILAIKVLFQQETPGLGARCTEIRKGETEPWWQTQFKSLNAASIALDKDGGTIESITGATITSRAITEGIAAKAQSIQMN